MKKSKKSLILFFLIVGFISFGGGCSNSSEEPSFDGTTVPTYTVTFDHDGVSLTPPIQRVKRGETIVQPLVPTKDDHVFVSWYTDQDRLHRHNFADPITQNITLCARWISLDDYNKQMELLEFTPIGDGTGYSMKKKSGIPRTGITGELIIPDSWNGKPVTAIGNGAFAGCTGLTSITLPDSLTAIGPFAFAHCSRLTSITLPDSLTAIGDFAFKGSGLTSITLPASLTSLGEAAFNGTRLTSVTVNSPTPPPPNWGNYFASFLNIQIKVPKEAVGAYQSAPGWKKYSNKISAID